MIIIYTTWHIAVMCIRRDKQNVIYIPTYEWRNSSVIITPNVIATLFWRNGGVIVTWCNRRGWNSAPRCLNVKFHMKLIYYYILLLLSYLYNANINICHNQHARTGPQSGCYCLHGANTSLALYNFSTRASRANRNAMSAWHFFMLSHLYPDFLRKHT